MSDGACPKREDGGHCCWHLKSKSVTVWRESASVCDGQQCCWCGATKPFTLAYSVPIPHGPFYDNR